MASIYNTILYLTFTLTISLSLILEYFTLIYLTFQYHKLLLIYNTLLYYTWNLTCYHLLYLKSLFHTLINASIIITTLLCSTSPFAKFIFSNNKHTVAYTGHCGTKSLWLLIYVLSFTDYINCRF